VGSEMCIRDRLDDKLVWLSKRPQSIAVATRAALALACLSIRGSP
jgi:hypothetical protein